MNRAATRLALAAGLLLGATSLLAASAERRKSQRSSATPASAAPAAASVSPAQSFDAFQLVVERNIFNPNRVGRTRPTSDEAPPRGDEISLVGTLQSDRDVIAFFDSPNTSFRKALREGQTVADFKVQRIAADSVDLLRGETPLTLKVTQQLRRPVGGEWTVHATTPAAPAASARPSTNGSSTPAATSEPELPADASEVLKRLIKKREKQLK